MPAAYQGEAWNHQVDFLVVGSGCGGLTAALTADARGLDTLIIEKAGVYGPITPPSRQKLWATNTPNLRGIVLADSRYEF
jgi:3-oxosteroid 1-dehydrogenase